MIISPLQLDQLTRDTWGSYDPLVIAQLAPLAGNKCYQPKFYKSPASQDELMAAGAYVQHGLKFTAGSLIFGTYLPAMPTSSDGFNLSPSVPRFNVQITDTSLQQEWFDEAIPSLFLSNAKPEYIDSNPLNTTAGGFPNLLSSPWPVVGSGIMLIEIWNDPNLAQRVQLIFGVLEVVG
jgi:hypothetical protein